MKNARCAVLACLVAASAPGCGDPPPSPPPAPPKVRLMPMPRELLGTSVALRVEVTGCAQVRRVVVRDRQAVLAEADAPPALSTLTAPAKAVRYKERGIPAPLALFADATCDDGRAASSDEVAVLFMPADEVVAGPWPFSNNFWAEEDGAAFLSCDRELSRWGKDRQRLAHLSLPFDCGRDAELSLLDDGERLLLKPGLGVVRFRRDLTQRYPLTIEGVEQAVAPAGGPLVAVAHNGISRTLLAWGGEDGQPLWSSGATGKPAGALAFNRLGRVVYPSFAMHAVGSTLVDLQLETFDAATGKPAGTHVLGAIKSDLMSDVVVPRVSFDATAETAYFAELADPAFVWACDAVSGKPCTDFGGGLRWKSAALSGGLVAAVRTPGGLVAYGPHVAYFLDPETGATIGETVTPTGSLEFRYVLASPDGAIFLLAMAAGEAGIKEVVVFDAPGRKVADFVTGTEGYVVDVDRAGRAWLWKSDLVKLLPASQYRAAL